MKLVIWLYHGIISYCISVHP